MKTETNPRVFRITNLYADKVHELKRYVESSTGLSISHTQAIYYAVENTLNNIKGETKA